MATINPERLLRRLRVLAEIGRAPDGRLVRLAASYADKLGRDALVAWLQNAGLDIKIDRIGNIFGIWAPKGVDERSPVMIGSHIDTVIDAGALDGCYGVLGALEVVETLREAGFVPRRPIALAAFTNEEGVRYAPDMMGSLVYAGGLDVDEALAKVGVDGTVLGEELARIGYAGSTEPGFLVPSAYVELHIEQGPILEHEGYVIGAVDNLQGISWQKVTLDGVANHAGTTPMSMRRDACYAAALTIAFINDLARNSDSSSVATVGSMRIEPNAINVIPSRAVFTVDLRDPDERRLRMMEDALAAYLRGLPMKTGARVSVERLARFEPVRFDERIVRMVEQAAARRRLPCRRMTSGAGHDAQMIARMAPSAMIFTPSIAGVSHNPEEATAEVDLVAGANVLLDVVCDLASDAEARP
jgi:beta-ureidopropionase / N-carbamoyl-L-amino-acid hydrolase